MRWPREAGIPQDTEAEYGPSAASQSARFKGGATTADAAEGFQPPEAQLARDHHVGRRAFRRCSGRWTTSLMANCIEASGR
jgi:hypothetical protein